MCWEMCTTSIKYLFTAAIIGAYYLTFQNYSTIRVSLTKMSSISASDNQTLEGSFKLSRVTSYHFPQSIDRQAIVLTNDRRNTCHTYSSNFKQRVVPPWTNKMKSTPLTSTDREKQAAALEYCWIYDPFLLPPASLKTQSSKSESSNNSSMPPGDSEVSTSPNSENEALHQSGQGRSVDQCRVIHNQVEQRYRHRVRDNINALWNVIPESSTTIQPSKAVVLTRAKEHILELQQYARREKREKETLQAKVQMLENFLAERTSTTELSNRNVNYSVV